MSRYIVVAGTIGLLSSTVGIGSVLAAIFLTQNFSWDKPLSDMGDISAPTAPIFNYGLMGSGLLGVFFATGLFKRLSHIVGRIGASFLVIASSALVFVGIFPLGIEFGNFRHIVASFVFFVFLCATLVTVGIGFVKTHQFAGAVGTVPAAAVATVFGIIMLSDKLMNVTLCSFGLAEFIPSVTLSVWVFIMGLEMVIQRR